MLFFRVWVPWLCLVLIVPPLTLLRACAEIAREASNHEKYPQIISMLWQRLAEHGENWRRCYKALLVCEYLVKHGPMVRRLHWLLTAGSLLHSFVCWRTSIHSAFCGCHLVISQRCVEEFQLSVGAFERLRDQFQYKDLDGRDQVSCL